MDAGRASKAAQLLADDPVGVERESSPRTIQQKRENIFYSHIAAGWLRQLNAAKQGEPVYHSLSLGMTPIIITQPAIIIQPLGVLSND